MVSEAKDNTKLDVTRLLLLGLLYCKGSRIGKSNFLFPLLTQDQNLLASTPPSKKHHQATPLPTFGMDPDDVQRLGWVDLALAEMGRQRRIRVFTRHYQAAMTLAEQNDLIVTLPTRATWLKRDNPRVVVRQVPFDIPALTLKMAWSPLLQHNPGHRWVRQLITQIARTIEAPRH